MDKEVTIYGDYSTVPAPRQVGAATHHFRHRWKGTEFAKIVFINNYWVTFEASETNEKISEPLSKLTLSYDDKKDQLKVIIDY